MRVGSKEQGNNKEDRDYFMLNEYDRRKKLICFSAVFFGIYLLFIAYRIVRVYIGGCGYPTADFRFYPDDRFKDFFTINYAVKDRNPYLTDLSNYPPLVLLFAFAWSKLFGEDWSGFGPVTLQEGINDPAIRASFVTFWIAYFVIFLAICVVYGLKKKKEGKASIAPLSFFVGAMLMGSAPNIFLLDRGNYLAITVILFLLWAICEQESPDKMWGPVLLALCAATKIYPVYIIGLYLIDRRWRHFLVSVFTGLAVTVAGIFCMYGNFIDNVKHFGAGVLGFGGGGLYSGYFTVGLTGLCTFIFRLFGLMPKGGVTKIVWLFSGAVLTLLGMWLLRGEKKVWKKIMVATALMTFLTPNAYLYNSTYMFPSIFLMLTDKETMKKEDMPYVLMSAMLLVPKAFKYLPDIPDPFCPQEYNTMNVGIAVDALLYLGIIVYYFVRRIKEKKAV